MGTSFQLYLNSYNSGRITVYHFVLYINVIYIRSYFFIVYTLYYLLISKVIWSFQTHFTVDNNAAETYEEQSSFFYKVFFQQKNCQIAIVVLGLFWMSCLKEFGYTNSFNTFIPRTHMYY